MLDKDKQNDLFEGTFSFIFSKCSVFYTDYGLRLLINHCLNGKNNFKFCVKKYIRELSVNEQQSKSQMLLFLMCHCRGFQSHVVSCSANFFTPFIFMQDCGFQIHPEESCGLQPLSHEYLSAISQTVLKTCEAGDAKGLCLVFSTHAPHQNRSRKRCFFAHAPNYTQQL